MAYGWFFSLTNLSVTAPGVTACTGWNAAAIDESTIVWRAASESAASSGDCAPPTMPSCVDAARMLPVRATAVLRRNWRQRSA